MAIAITLEDYLKENGVHYDLIAHPGSRFSMETAAAVHIPGDKLAKSVILEDEGGYLMAVLPATHHVELGKLSKTLKRRLGLATEQELAPLFVDCDPRAIPPVGPAYGIETIIDDQLSHCDDVYFEAGTRDELIHMKGDDFLQLFRHAKHGRFSRHI